jgi:gamma-glutamyltranspeptidase/glutathione hydrolase
VATPWTRPSRHCLVLSVSDSGNFCFGGEVPIMVYDARRKVVEVLSGQGAAPRLATLDYFQRHKGGHIPAGGDPTTAAIPAALDACLTALDRYGTLSFAEVAQPMQRLLRQSNTGWKADLSKTIGQLIEAEKGCGERRRGLRLVADCFYRGPIAREIDAWSRQHGGLLRYADLAMHVTRVEEPLSIPYRGYTICKCGPWTQGPYLLETLRLLEPLNLKAMGHNRPDYVHVLAEAMKLGLADRDTYYADPLLVDVPMRDLLSSRYADLRRPLLDMTRTSLELRPGDPIAGRALLGKMPQAYRLPPEGPVQDTTTCVVADREGNVVAATPSGWGGVMAGRTGVMLGSRLRSLNTWPGHPNCIEPGKRPRITLSPTLVLREGKPVAAISVAGGDQQDQVTLQLLLDWIVFGLGPAEAVTAPRFITNHHIGSFNQTPPQLGSLLVEESLGKETIDALSARGHRVQVQKPPFGHPVMLVLDPATGQKQAAGDPKLEF